MTWRSEFVSCGHPWDGQDGPRSPWVANPRDRLRGDGGGARSRTSMRHVHDVDFWSGWRQFVCESPSSAVPEGIFICERRKGDGWPSKDSAIHVSTSSGWHRSGRSPGVLRSRRPSARDAAATGRGFRGRAGAVSGETASGRPGRDAIGCRLPTYLSPPGLGACRRISRSLRGMGVMESADALTDPGEGSDITALIPVVRRVISARVSDASAAEDLVQETLVRVLGAAHRIEPGMLEPYAIVTARNVVASLWKERDRRRRNQHRVLDLSPVEAPDDELLRQEDGKAIATALERLSERERQTLLAHEVSGLDTRVLGADLGLTAGAVAAQLNRSRARLRVEYLLALHDVDPPTEQCRPVLLALSGGERRRQQEVHAARHLLECDVCAELSLPLMNRGQRTDTEVRVPIHDAPDVVLARKQARERAITSGILGDGPDHPRYGCLRDSAQHRSVRRQGGGAHRDAGRSTSRTPSDRERHRTRHPRRRPCAERRVQHLQRVGDGSARRSSPDG